MRWAVILLVLLWCGGSDLAWGLKLKKVIYGKISPKSIVYSGRGLFFAQNMMYRHTITVYNRKYRLVKTISDRVKLSKLGHRRYKGTHRGSPVEVAFSHGGRVAWVSNYKMFGSGFPKSARDRCRPSQKLDESFVYRIDTQKLAIVGAIRVGAVPKYLAVTPDDKRLLVTNWCSWDLSVVDIKKGREVRRIRLGRYPRGIAIDPAGRLAYVAVMGSYHIAVVNLKDYSLRWMRRVGRMPRHLNMDPQGRYLYVSLNGENRVAKIDLKTQKVVRKVRTGSVPRSMSLTPDGRFLYVVNYYSATVVKIRTRDLKVVARAKTHKRPIGVTYDSQTRQVWVACYRGSILIFQDHHQATTRPRQRAKRPPPRR
jgi:YVTN family beta-propeller protein